MYFVFKAAGRTCRRWRAAAASTHQWRV